VLTKWISKKFDKKNTYVGCMLISAVANCFVYFLEPGDVVLIYLLNIVVSFVWGRYLSSSGRCTRTRLPEWKHNRRATGLIMVASLFR
jgi:GPH family glycoside/pentoside/hexuronide:cation symporter